MKHQVVSPPTKRGSHSPAQREDKVRGNFPAAGSARRGRLCALTPRLAGGGARIGAPALLVQGGNPDTASSGEAAVRGQERLH